MPGISQRFVLLDAFSATKPRPAAGRRAVACSLAPSWSLGTRRESALRPDGTPNQVLKVSLCSFDCRNSAEYYRSTTVFVVEGVAIRTITRIQIIGYRIGGVSVSRRAGLPVRELPRSVWRESRPPGPHCKLPCLTRVSAWQRLLHLHPLHQPHTHHNCYVSQPVNTPR